MKEIAGATKWLIGKLLDAAGVTALVDDRVFPDAAPADAPHPFILVSLNSAPVALAVGRGERLFMDPLYLVKAVSRSDGYAEAYQIGIALDAALNGAFGTVDVFGDTVQIDGCDLEEPYQETEQEGEDRYAHVGGLYRLTAYEL